MTVDAIESARALLLVTWWAVFAATLALGYALNRRRLIRALLVRITDKCPAERITHEGRSFMDRFELGVHGGRQYVIHRFFDSDPDGRHSHPWQHGLSIILLGRYIEETNFGMRVVRFFNLVGGDKMHRLHVLDGECWSLFVHDARRKEWVFRRVTAQGVRYDVVSDDFSGRPFRDREKVALTGRELRRRAREQEYLNAA